MIIMMYLLRMCNIMLIAEFSLDFFYIIFLAIFKFGSSFEMLAIFFFVHFDSQMYTSKNEHVTLSTKT